MSPFNYCFNNPVMWNDLNGMQPGDDDPPKLQGTKEPESGFWETQYSDGSYTGVPEVHELEGVAVTGEKKRGFWEKAGAFAKGFVKGVVIAAAVVGTIALIAATGPVGLVIAGVATKALIGVGVAVTVKTGYELISGKEAFTGRKLGELEKWEMGGELVGGIVAGGRMMRGSKKAPVSTKAPVTSEAPTSRWTSNATEAPVYSEPTNTGAPKFSEPTSSGTTKFSEPTSTNKVSNTSYDVAPVGVRRGEANLESLVPIEDGAQIDFKVDAIAEQLTDLKAWKGHDVWPFEPLRVTIFENKAIILDGHHRFFGAKKANYEGMIPIEVVPIEKSGYSIEELRSFIK